MAALTETSTFEPAIYQLETVDPVLGGAGGISNLQPQQLANRTKYLKDRVDALETAAPDMASKAYVAAELEKLDHKQSVRLATTGNTSLTGAQTIDGVVGAPGDRVLVKSNSAAAENGIYLMNAGAWTRASDANSAADITSGLVVAVEEGTLNANTRWQLTTDGTIVVGVTGLVFANISAGYAPLASPTFTGDPTAPTPASGDKDTSIATTAFVDNATGGIATIDVSGAAATIALTAAQAGCGIILLTGVRTADLALHFPAQPDQWIVANDSTGSYNITAKTPAGAGVVLPQSLAVVVYGDGTDINFAASAAQVSFVTQRFAPAAGATSLTVSGGYTPGNIMVLKNGVPLDQSTDFSAPTSPGIFLTTPSIAGDVFVVHAFSSFTVANAVAKAGDTMTGTLTLAGDAAGALDAVPKRQAESVAAPGQCLLSKSGANLLLSPYKGNKLFINGAAYPVPGAGVTLAPPATTNTSYFIYAYMAAGVMTLEASATTPAWDANGWRIKTGDATRTLVGQARTVSSAWVDAGNKRFVRSWFNPRSVVCNGSLPSTAIDANTSFVELNNQMRSEFLLWEGETVTSSASGECANNTANQTMSISAGFNGIVPEDVVSTGQSTSGSLDLASLSVVAQKSGLAEGYNYAALLIKTSGGSGTWYGGSTAGARWSLNSKIGF